MRSDKGTVTTAIKKAEYLHQCRIILSDVQYYKVTDRCPTITIQSKSNTSISNLKNKG